MKTEIHTIAQEVEITGWKKFWLRLDGNKTLILSMVATTVSLTPVPEPYKSIALGILGLLGAKTGYDHIKNGWFKSNVNKININKI